MSRGGCRERSGRGRGVGKSTEYVQEAGHKTHAARAALPREAEAEPVEGLAPVAADMETVFRLHADKAFGRQLPHGAGDRPHGQLQLFCKAAAADRPAFLSTAARDLHVHGKGAVRKAADSFGFNGKGVAGMANIVVADKLALCYF